MKTGLATILTVGIEIAFTLSTHAVTPTPATVPASTAPVVIASEVAGFATIDVTGASLPDQPQLSLKAIGLINPTEYKGVAETARGKLFTDKQATWTEEQFNPPKATIATATHYLEVTSGPLAGALFDIVRTDAVRQTLTLGQVVPVKIGPKPGFRVRKHWTLAGVFGAANAAGLEPGDESTADQVSIYNGKTYDKYYFSNGTAGNGWRRVGGGTVDVSGRQIYPDDGLAITRRAAGPLSTLIKGVVKTDRTLIPVQKGMNLVANVYQAPFTLADSQLYTRSLATGVRAGATAALADNVLIYNEAGSQTYYYQSSVLNGSGWRLGGDLHTDVGSTVIPVGSAFVIQRRTGSFTWMAPAPTP